MVKRASYTGLFHALTCSVSLFNQEIVLDLGCEKEPVTIVLINDGAFGPSLLQLSFGIRLDTLRQYSP